MNINILGFNIFAKGGTSRSNINLIKAFINEGYFITYFNYQEFDFEDIARLVIHEDINPKKINIKFLSNAKELANGEMLIITRESLFYYASIVKNYNKSIKIIGEIHAPLTYIEENIDLSLDYIDSIRVSTNKIKRDFINKYNYDAVFNQFVNTGHIKISEDPINTKHNFLIKSRFEDNVKDISYVIKLFNYIFKNYETKDIHLYIIGYGPSEVLFKNLVNYYSINRNVHINTVEPKDCIYISTSYYETLGYSILEALASGNRALVYPGNDDVLKEIYYKYNGIEFLKKNIVEDAKLLINYLNKEYTKSKRMEDVENLNNDFNNDKYISEYIKGSRKAQNNKTLMSFNTYNKGLNLNNDSFKIEKLKAYRELYIKLKKVPVISLIFKNSFIYGFFENYYNKKISKFDNFKKNNLDNNKIFVESFHGHNFSGDPKYIALAIKNQFKDKVIYVSSRNALVDLEIREYGLTPVRFGSQVYIDAFTQSKYIIINGNSWDKVGKHSGQLFIQTWHGFPLKKMVSDINDIEERKKQTNNFLPRMKKWDYLLLSSKINEMLLDSAFTLKENEHLTFLESGSPRNSYLINNNNITEKRKLQKKYFFQEKPEKKYILFCPTWRINNRKKLTDIDLNKLLSFLPSNYEIIVKLHNNEAHMRKTYANINKRVHCFFNELVDIQELYILSDCMITDYSSTIFDYAHLNKPIFLLNEDLKEYNRETGFYFNINELGNFPIVPVSEKALANKIIKTKEIDYSQLIQKLMHFDTSDSASTIVDYLFNIKQKH